MLLGQRSGANCGAWNPAGRIERTFGVAQKVRADTFYKAENIMFEGILSLGKRIRCCKVVTALELQYCSYNNQRKNCWEHIFWSVLPCCYSTNVILTSKLLCTSEHLHNNRSGSQAQHGDALRSASTRPPLSRWQIVHTRAAAQKDPPSPRPRHHGQSVLSLLLFPRWCLSHVLYIS
jgi:hypothetical protein